jgi:toxin-antitoxin system PIN domain toxin
MIVLDVNVLIACSRSDHPHHRIALPWLEQALVANTPLASIEILPVVASGFLRLATHPKVFKHPTPLKDATRFLDALLAQPGVEMGSLGAQDWQHCAAVCKAQGLTGNAIPDALIAGAVLARDARLASFDRDFRVLLPDHALILLSST